MNPKKALKKERQERKKQEIKQRQQLYSEEKPTHNRIRREDAFAHMEEDVER